MLAYILIAKVVHGPGKLRALKKNASAWTPSTSSIIWSYLHYHTPTEKYVGKFQKNGSE